MLVLRLSLIINLLDLVSGSGSQGRPWVSVKMELSSINMQKKKNKASISHLDRTSLVETDVKNTIFMRAQQRAIPSGQDSAILPARNLVLACSDSQSERIYKCI